jgi:hypothetical protein
MVTQHVTLAIGCHGLHTDGGRHLSDSFVVLESEKHAEGK